MSKCDFSKIAKFLWRAAFIYLQEYTSKAHLSRKKLKRKWISYLVPSFPIIPYSKIVNTFFIAFFSFPLCQLILLFFIIAPPPNKFILIQVHLLIFKSLTRVPANKLIAATKWIASCELRANELWVACQRPASWEPASCQPFSLRANELQVYRTASCGTARIWVESAQVNDLCIYIQRSEDQNFIRCSFCKTAIAKLNTICNIGQIY